MSQMNLTQEFIDQLQQLLEQTDSQCRDDGIAAQYLAAVIGLKLGSAELPAEKKGEIRDHLCAFIGQVADDVAAQQQPEPQQPPEEAFGIWRPGD